MSFIDTINFRDRDLEMVNQQSTKQHFLSFFANNYLFNFQIPVFR